MKKNDQVFMAEAIRLAREGMHGNIGGPFGAVVVKDGRIIGRGCNRVAEANDPTAHAEIVAIRDACRRLGRFQLDGCVIYTSCEPCPMCLGAIYWARPRRIVYACSRRDAAAAGFDDEFIYREIDIPPDRRAIPAEQQGREQGLELFREWNDKEDKCVY
jgi:tRNA(Arg) A34 adenosine deaminase TadA